MKSWKTLFLVSCTAVLSGCASDLVAPPREFHPNLAVAETARARGDVAQAIHNYREIIKECPEYEKAYIGLGWSLLDGNAVDEARETFQKAQTLFPKSSDAYTGLGMVFLLVNQPESAIKSFECALKLNPCNDKALNGYGIALDMLCNYQAAQANYRAAMELCPGNLSYESNLALSLALSGNTREAIRILERLACSPKATPRVRQNLALAYALAGDIKMAEKVGRADLSNDMIMNNIKYIKAIHETRDYAGTIPKGHTNSLDAGRKWQER